MYTNLKHERISSNLENTIEEARDNINKMPTKKQEELNMVLKSDLNIMEHVCFIVKNTYLCTKEGVLRHQEIGLPMGTNCAPELANLTLYHDEAAYIDNLVHFNEDIAKRHCHNFRFIDDVLCWDEEPPSPEIYGLEWSETTNSNGSVNFLGGKIQNIDGRISTSLFDKAAEWQFPFLRYPHFDSNVP
jgi:hypothetical protein